MNITFLNYLFGEMQNPTQPIYTTIMNHVIINKLEILVKAWNSISVHIEATNFSGKSRYLQQIKLGCHFQLQFMIQTYEFSWTSALIL